MFDVFTGIFATFMQHPYLVAGLFIAAALLIIWKYSENGLKEALLSILRVLGYFFTVPHEFMRTCLRHFSVSESLQAPYVGTRQYVLHKFNQLQFLFAFVAGLLILSAGIGTTLLALYPSAEINRRDALEKSLDASKKKLVEADAKVTEISSPNFAQVIGQKRAGLENAARTKTAEYETHLQNIGYTSPLINEISYAYPSDEFKDVEQKTAEITEYFRECPQGDSWSQFNAEMCKDMLDKVSRLYQLKLETLDAQSKLEEAVGEQRNMAGALEDAKETQTELKQQVATEEKAYENALLRKGTWIKAHVKTAAGLLVFTIFQFLAFIWGYALLSYFVSWIAHVMRAVERKAED